ncbi:hypothetical protein TWF281_009522 [Arthrobotrys megalospora]
MLSTVYEDPEGEEAAEREDSFAYGEGEDEGEGGSEDESDEENAGDEDVEDRMEGRADPGEEESGQYGDFNNRGGIQLGSNYNWWERQQ